MYSNVSLYALDAQTGESLSNAVMKVLSVSSPATVVTVETANELGRVDLLLPLGDYDVRLFHPGTTFGGAKRIRVVGEVDSFDLKGRRVHPMDALDPNICVVHGFFRHPNGRPYRNLDVHVIPEFTPILVQGAAVVGGPVIVRTDEQGWVRLDMFRGTVYTIEVEGYDHGRKSVYIPDAPQWNLPDLLFPRITSLRFASLPSPVQLQVGETLTLPAEFDVSDGRTLKCTTEEVTWSNTGSEFVEYTLSPDAITLRGLRAGSSQIQVRRRSTSVYSMPYVEVQNGDIDVVVT